MGGLETSIVDSLVEVQQSEWNNVVKQSDGGTAFDRYEWLEAYERAHRPDARYVQVRKNGTLVGVHSAFARPLSGTPFRYLEASRSGFNGFAIQSDERAVLSAMLDELEANRSRRTVGHTVKPLSTWLLQHVPELRSRRYRPSVGGCHFVVDLDRPWEEIEADFDSSKRSDLRKADELGVEVREEALTPDAVRRFYRKYETMVRRIGGDRTSYDFLRRLATTFDEHLKLFVAEVDGEPVGWQLAVVDEDNSWIYFLLLAVTRDDYEYYPTHVLTRHAIKWGIERGYDHLNFGDTEPDATEGTFRFKSEFGGRLVPVLGWKKSFSRLGQLFKDAGGHRKLERAVAAFGD